MDGNYKNVESTKWSSTLGAGMTIREYTTNSKVWLIYNLQDTFARTDQMLFDLPLERRLLQTQQQKKNWLSLVSRYHPTTNARRVGNQQLITKFLNQMTENRKGEPQPLLSAHSLPWPTQTQRSPKLRLRRTILPNQTDKGWRSLNLCNLWTEVPWKNYTFFLATCPRMQGWTVEEQGWA